MEDAGVLVFQFPKVPLNQVRGVSLFEFPLPVVGINSKETSPDARVYTLVHELVHIALALNDEETVALREPRSDAEWAEVERFVEEAAREAIIPGARRTHWDASVASVPARRRGMASPVDKTFGRAGRPFSQLVVQALDANRITAVQASRHLGLRFDYVEKLRSELRICSAGAVA